MTTMTTPITLPTPTSHTDWLEQRRHGIGSSDASVILGLSNYESPYTLWLEKTGRTPLDPTVDDRTQELRDWGHRMEPLVRDETAKRLGIQITKPDHAVAHPDRPWQRTNVDGLTNDGTIFEAKNTSSFLRHLWVGQVPDHAEIQVHHSAAILGATKAIVAGLVGGNELIIHEIDINPNIVEMVTAAEADFWRHVEDDTPPEVDGHVRTMEAITREWAHKPGARDIDPNDVQGHWDAYQAAKADEKAAADRKREAAAHIAALMDGHDQLTTGKRVWAKAQPGRLDMRRLKDEHPDLVDEFTRPTTAFDLDAFKTDHPDVYRAFQTVTIRPTTK